MVHTIFVCVFIFLHITSAYDIFEGFLKQSGPCFPVIQLPEQCNTTLAEVFKAKSLKSGMNEPTTLVFLFTPSSPDTAEELHLCGGQLPPGSTFDPEAETIVLIHGWLDGVCRTGWMREYKEQFKCRGKYNIIMLDWTWGNTFDYALAGNNSKIVGEQAGFIMNNIRRQTGADPRKFHVIGHSLGAIAGGFAGRSFIGLGRITGLDPAYAPMGLEPPDQRLTYRDARLVIIIHSNGFECYALGIGDSRQLGHADFYPNGGQVQLSCYPEILTYFLNLDLFSGVVSLDPRLCSHLQSIRWFKVSICPKDCQFVGIEDESYEGFLAGNKSGEWAVMGMDYELYNSNSDGRRRKYYLKTRNHCPYYDDSYLGGRQFPFNAGCTS